MNSEIEGWRSQAYAANVTHLSQQKASRLAPVVRKEMFKGKAEFFDRLASGVAVERTSRNADTQNLDLTHSRRMLTTSMYEWATLVDRKDKLQNIHSPESEYAKAASASLGRAMDDVLISSILGGASSGEAGASTSTLAVTNKIAAVSAAAISKLNVLALRQAKYLLDAAEAEGPRYFVTNASGITALLGATEVSSSDYNTVKALVMGEVDTFLGFKFIRSERLILSSVNANSFIYNTSTGLYDAGGTAISGTPTAVSSFAFCGDGIILGMNEGAYSKIEPRADKGYSMQVYASMDFGAVRMEEAKVVEVQTLP